MIATPNTHNRLDYLDGWRGMAIVLVLASHFIKLPFVNTGRLGVDIFFVLSGLLMGKILFITQTPLKPFFIRRFSRVFPLVFVYITFWCALDFFFQLSNAQEYQNIFYTLTFLRTYFPEGVSIWGTGIPIGHFWTLNVEEHAYIVLGVVAAMFAATGRAGFAAIAVGFLCVFILFCYAIFPDYAPQQWSIRSESVAFFIFFSAGYQTLRHKVEPYVHPLMPLIAFVLAVLVYTDLTLWWQKPLLAPLLLVFTVNHLQNLPKRVLRALEATWLRRLGLWSFSIYIWHVPFYIYGMKAENASPEWRYVYVALSIFVGYLSFKYIETPTRRYLVNRFAPRNEARPAATAPTPS